MNNLISHWIAGHCAHARRLAATWSFMDIASALLAAGYSQHGAACVAAYLKGTGTLEAALIAEQREGATK